MFCVQRMIKSARSVLHPKARRVKRNRGWDGSRSVEVFCSDACTRAEIIHLFKTPYPFTPQRVLPFTCVIRETRYLLSDKSTECAHA